MASSNSSKWDDYYRRAEQTNTTPPWESSEPFNGLLELKVQHPEIFIEGKSCIELGSGASASAVWLAAQGFQTTAVDICPLAIKRAQTRIPNSGSVNWVTLDLMGPDVIEKLGNFDFVFDMQCFHVLRDMDQNTIVETMLNLLKPGGYLMVVTGAHSVTALSAEFKGPPQLLEEEVIEPFQSRGLSLLSLHQSRFNMTAHYALLPEVPSCWVALFRK